MLMVSINSLILSTTQRSNSSYRKDFNAVCIQLTDKLDANVMGQLAKAGIKLIDLRSAGYDNVDLRLLQIIK
jgi:D-lactate dehydrogenase